MKCGHILPGTIYTIGHSTHSLDGFIHMLHSFQIEMVVDIRNYPGSKRYPYFNQFALEQSLPAHGIKYLHIKALGGRRRANPDSKNIVWRHPAFRGYADYMETAAFDEGVAELQEVASKFRVAMMCSEAVWWRCHRSMVSDLMKSCGWDVQHIMSVGKSTEHPYTAPAKVVDGNLMYH